MRYRWEGESGIALAVRPRLICNDITMQLHTQHITVNFEPCINSKTSKRRPAKVKNGAGPLLYATMGRRDNSSDLSLLVICFSNTTQTVLSPEEVEQAVSTNGN